MSKPHIDPDLAVGLNYDADDLAANRAGRMSERQMASLMGNAAALWIGAGVALVFLLLWLGLFALLYSQAQDDTTRSAVIIANAIIGGLVVLVSVFVALERRKVLADRREGRVEQISGKLMVDARNTSVIVENRRFRLPSTALLRFQHLEPYTLYYAPRSKQVLSAERFEG